MLKQNDPSTGLDYIEETLLYLALQGWYDIDSAKVFNRLSTADKQWNTRRAHLLRLQHSQDKPLFHSMLAEVHHFIETHVHGGCWSITLTSFRDASKEFEIPNFVQLFHSQIKEDLGHKVSEPVLRYD